MFLCLDSDAYLEDIVGSIAKLVSGFGIVLQDCKRSRQITLEARNFLRAALYSDENGAKQTSIRYEFKSLSPIGNVRFGGVYLTDGLAEFF